MMSHYLSPRWTTISPWPYALISLTMLFYPLLAPSFICACIELNVFICWAWMVMVISIDFSQKLVFSVSAHGVRSYVSTWREHGCFVAKLGKRLCPKESQRKNRQHDRVSEKDNTATAAPFPLFFSIRTTTIAHAIRTQQFVIWFFPSTPMVVCSCSLLTSLYMVVRIHSMIN